MCGVGVGSAVWQGSIKYVILGDVWCGCRECCMTGQSYMWSLVMCGVGVGSVVWQGSLILVMCGVGLGSVVWQGSLICDPWWCVQGSLICDPWWCVTGQSYMWSLVMCGVGVGSVVQSCAGFCSLRRWGVKVVLRYVLLVCMHLCKWVLITYSSMELSMAVVSVFLTLNFLLKNIKVPTPVHYGWAVINWFLILTYLSLLAVCLLVA